MNKLRQMLQPFIGIFFLVILSFPTQADIHRIDVSILPESIVYSEYYTLGDIAELDGFDVETIQNLAKLEIGKSPLPGRSFVISRNRIQKRLKGNFSGMKFKLHMPPKSFVSRASLKITAKQINKIALKEIRKYYKQYDEVKITLKSALKDIYIPKGKFSYKMEQVGQNIKIGGYSSWMLILQLDQKEVKKLLLRAKIDVFDDVLVAKGRISKGKLITKSDLVKVKKNISREKKGYQSASDLVIGKEARRAIYKNEAVKATLVGEPVIIQKGMPIKLVYKTGKMRLTNMAIAMKSGKKGDIIPVRTLNSRKIIYAVIMDVRQAEVAL